MDDVKEKLLQYLMQQSHSLLTSHGCPIDQKLLVQISEGDCPETLPQNTEDAFSDWFRDQVTKGLVKNKCSSTHDYEDDINNHNHVGDVDVVDDDDDGEDEHLDIDDSEQVETGSNQSELHSSSSPDQVHQMSPNLPQGTGLPHYNSHHNHNHHHIDNNLDSKTAESSSTLAPPPTTPVKDNTPPPSNTVTSPYKQPSTHYPPGFVHHIRPESLTLASPPLNNPTEPTQHLPGSYPHHRQSSLSSPGYGPPSATGRPRARTSFDPEQEVPRLQKWFEANQHPSRELMCGYMNDLNSLPSRQGRRPLDLTNIIYWFKNARAASRRAVSASRGADLSGYLDSSFGGDSSLGDEEDCYDADAASSPTSNHSDVERHVSPISNHRDVERHVPELPNKNAVYVVTPIHHSDEEVKDNIIPKPVEIIPEDDKPQDFTVPKLNGQSTAVLDNNNHVGKDDRRLGSVNSNTTDDDSPTDLSMPKKRRMSYEIESNSHTVSNGYDRASKMSRLMIRTKDESYSQDHAEEDDFGSSNTSSPSPSPKSLNSSGSSGLSSSAHHLGFHSMTQQALQMAAMSHALNMHYMHTPAAAAMYGGGLVGGLMPHPHGPQHPTGLPHQPSPYHSNATSPRPPQHSPGVHHHPHHSTPSSHHMTSHMSSDERKKRSRVFIDPLTEIPKLEKWFIEDTHPSSYMIEKYTEELNNQPYRQRFPNLEPKNVQLWFKNHRAKVKRARQEQVALCQINHQNAIKSS